MPMIAQPEGLRRVARDKGKPPQQYDVYRDGAVLGYTERRPGGDWRAWPASGDYPHDFGKHNDAMTWLAAQPLPDSSGEHVNGAVPAAEDPEVPEFSLAEAAEEIAQAMDLPPGAVQVLLREEPAREVPVIIPPALGDVPPDADVVHVGDSDAGSGGDRGPGESAVPSVPFLAPHAEDLFGDPFSDPFA